MSSSAPNSVPYMPHRHCWEGRRDLDFLVERPPKEVLNRAGVYLWRRGFGMPPGGHTDTSMLFTRRQKTQRKGRLRTMLNALVTATPISAQKVRLVASEVGEGRTRLTIIESWQGEWSGFRPTILAELEPWITKELEGTRWPL
jgi:hypothetical protein